MLPIGQQIAVCGNKALLTAVWCYPSWLSAHGQQPVPALCRSMNLSEVCTPAYISHWLQGDLIQDSHAEVVAKRALQHWLHAELLLCLRSCRAPQLKPSGPEAPLPAPANAARQVPLPRKLCGLPCAVATRMHVSWAPKHSCGNECWQVPGI